METPHNKELQPKQIRIPYGAEVRIFQGHYRYPKQETYILSILQLKNQLQDFAALSFSEMISELRHGRWFILYVLLRCYLWIYCSSQITLVMNIWRSNCAKPHTNKVVSVGRKDSRATRREPSSIDQRITEDQTKSYFKRTTLPSLL